MTAAPTAAMAMSTVRTLDFVARPGVVSASIRSLQQVLRARGDHCPISWRSPVGARQSAATSFRPRPIPAEETAMPLPPLETTRYEVQDGIATITLNRPDK